MPTSSLSPTFPYTYIWHTHIDCIDQDSLTETAVTLMIQITWSCRSISVGPISSESISYKNTQIIYIRSSRPLLHLGNRKLQNNNIMLLKCNMCKHTVQLNFKEDMDIHIEYG